MRQLNRADVLDRVEPVVHTPSLQPASTTARHGSASLARTRAAPPKSFASRALARVATSLVYSRAPAIPFFVVIYSCVLFSRSSCSQMVNFDIHHYTTELDLFHVTC